MRTRSRSRDPKTPGERLFLFIFFATLALPLQVETVQVSTPLGKVEGRELNFNGENVFQFLGIPYAKPPIGDLMLEKPQPVATWDDVFDATEYGPVCIQDIPFFQNETDFPFNQFQSLDCLKLNIYVPNSIETDLKKAVMLYIHGGFYRYGTGNSWDGSRLALTGDVILVSVNYRLDVFGFLSTEDNVIPGNYGLWDQRLAIKWVKDNIHSFGGDGDKITIFGQSAGSYSVGLHMLSPTNQGLFHGVISQSGTAVSPIALAYNARGYARRVSDYLNCTQYKEYIEVYNGKQFGRVDWDTQAFYECFKLKSLEDILEASARTRDQRFLAFIRSIGPVIDRDFLPDTPTCALKRDDIPFKHVDFMIGTNNADGGLIIVPLLNFQSRLGFNLAEGISRSVFINAIVQAIVKDYYRNDSIVAQKIIQQYSWSNISDFDQARQTVKMYGDLFFQTPVVEISEYHSELASDVKTYQYYFTHKPDQRRTFPWLEGAFHADELPFIFGTSLRYPSMSQPEAHFSKTLRGYWTNFAKHGNPNGNTSGTWPEYNADDRSYLDLSLTQIMDEDLLRNQVDFWRFELQLLSSLGRSCVVSTQLFVKNIIKWIKSIIST